MRNNDRAFLDTVPRHQPRFVKAISRFEPVALLMAKCISPSGKMQGHPSWSIAPVWPRPSWSDRVHNTPRVWQVRIAEWLKLIPCQSSVITELSVSSPWSFRLKQGESLISLYRCTQGPTKGDCKYRGQTQPRICAGNSLIHIQSLWNSSEEAWSCSFIIAVNRDAFGACQKCLLFFKVLINSMISEMCSA